jgi:hypothetical protein
MEHDPGLLPLHRQAVRGRELDETLVERLDQSRRRRFSRSRPTARQAEMNAATETPEAATETLEPPIDG